MDTRIAGNDWEALPEEPWAAARGVSLGVGLGLAFWATTILLVRALL
jgi:hypothetical protein